MKDIAELLEDDADALPDLEFTADGEFLSAVDEKLSKVDDTIERMAQHLGE